MDSMNTVSAFDSDGKLSAKGTARQSSKAMARQSTRHAEEMMRKAREEKLMKKHAANDTTKGQPQGKQQRQKNWRVGEKITVTKVGSQTGKKGVIENPEWNGRVMVKMSESGKIKSYASHEIRKETLTEKIAFYSKELAAAFVPKQLPKEAFDSKRKNQTSQETRKLAKRITSDMDHQLKAEHVGKDLRTCYTCMQLYLSMYLFAIFFILDRDTCYADRKLGESTFAHIPVVVSDGFNGVYTCSCSGRTFIH
jgi:hypothetical protein